MEPQNQYPIYTGRFWKAYAIHMRPYLLFVSGVAGAMGIAMGYLPDTSLVTCWLAFIPFFLGYGFGQALTDCFQTDTDKLSAPYRPLSKEIVSIRSVMTISIVGLLLLGVLLLTLHRLSFFLSLLAVFGLATYSFVKRRFWFGGPIYNGWIVALLPVMGYFSVRPVVDEVFPSAYYGFVLITFFSYANFVLIGYLKDIEADKVTSYQTFPVVFGWQKTILFGDATALVTLLLFWSLVQATGWSLVFGIAGSLIIILGQVSAHGTEQLNEKGALIPITFTLRGFLLLHLAIIMQFQPGWYVTGVIYYLLFEWALYKRPSIYQV